MFNSKFLYGFLLLAILITGCKSKNKDHNKTVTVNQGTHSSSSYPNQYKPQPKLQNNYTAQSRYSSNVRYTVVDYQQLPEWNQQFFEKSLISFQRSCRTLGSQPKWSYVCNIATQLGSNRKHAKRFFEENFQPWIVTNNINGGLAGKVTGYYEPALYGSKTKSSKFQYPIYGIPSDFISVPLPDNLRNYKGTVRISPTGDNKATINNNGTYRADLSQFNITAQTKAIKGRYSGSQFLPYYTRQEIYQGAINHKAPILAYANDPVELFFLQVQGSGRVFTDKDKIIRLAYADKNGYPYKSIGTYMAQQGYLPLNQTSMQGIKSYIQQNPGKLNEILGYNPSYVFFSESASEESEGPIGALGVPLTEGYSGAVDRHYIDLGAPIFLATTDTRNGKALNRLIVAQDTGSAINGSVRVDFFWGYGDEAGNAAGKTNHPGYIWILLPNGQQPL